MVNLILIFIKTIKVNMKRKAFLKVKINKSQKSLIKVFLKKQINLNRLLV
jgi:hypothetical protein